MEPKLISVSTNPEIDPYHSNTNGETRTQLFITLETGKYGLAQECDDNATPEDEWNGRTVTGHLAVRPDESEARSYLESDEAIALVQRVLDGGEVDWDGSNFVGHLNEDACAALDELVEDLENLAPNQWAIWDVNEWLNPTLDDMGIKAETTDEEIAALVETIETQAENENVIISGDVEEYLKKHRDELLADLRNRDISTVEAAEVIGITESGVRRAILRGSLKAEKIGRDWLISMGDAMDYQKSLAGRPRKTAAHE